MLCFCHSTASVEKKPGLRSGLNNVGLELVVVDECAYCCIACMLDEYNQYDFD